MKYIVHMQVGVEVWGHGGAHCHQQPAAAHSLRRDLTLTAAAVNSSNMLLLQGCGLSDVPIFTLRKMLYGKRKRRL